MTKKTSIPRIALVGVPNVGKSSLLNRLIGSRAVIIDDVAHTTRDTTEHPVNWDDQAVIVQDTPGFAHGGSELEAAAQVQLKTALQEADAIIFIVNVTVTVGDGERELARLVRKAGKPVIVALNQSDKQHSENIAVGYRALGFETMLPVSAHHGIGVAELKEAALGLVSKVPASALPGAAIRVAILGRPNVGKSSILNALTKRDLALVSAEAGTTRDPVAARVEHNDRTIEFTDTAGLRRPGKIGRDIEFFSLTRTRQVIGAADICVLVLDAAEPATAQDQHIAGMIREAGKGLVIVVNKIDSIDLEDERTRRRLDKRLANELDFVWWAPYILVSAVTGQHLDELLSQITTVYDNLVRKMKTTTLNSFLTKATLKQPPSATKNLRPKMNYLTQTSSNPIELVIFGTHPENIHFSYRRYLENQLREEFPLSGVPVKLIFKSKYTKKSD